MTTPRRALQRLALAALIPGGACDDAILTDDEPELGISCLRDPPLTYENFGRGFLERNCTGCHGSYVREGQRSEAPLEVNLDTWDDVLLWADRIEARSVDTNTMPPAGGPSEVERARLQEWLVCEVHPAIAADGGAP